MLYKNVSLNSYLNAFSSSSWEVIRFRGRLSLLILDCWWGFSWRTAHLHHFDEFLTKLRTHETVDEEVGGGVDDSQELSHKIQDDLTSWGEVEGIDSIARQNCGHSGKLYSFFLLNIILINEYLDNSKQPTANLGRLQRMKTTTIVQQMLALKKSRPRLMI